MILYARKIGAMAIIAAVATFAAPTTASSSKQESNTPSYLEYIAARVLIDEGRLAEAAAALEKVIASDPDAATAYRDLAETYLKMGDGEKAMAMADEIARRFDDKETVRFLATLYFYTFSHKRAAYYFEKVLETDPDDEDAMTFLANYYSAVKPDEAIKYLDKLSARNPDDAAVVARLAAVYEKLKIYDAAIGHYRKAMALDTEFKEAHLALSRIYEVMRDTRAAIGEYGAYLEADPRNAAVLAYLGALYFAAGELDKAGDTFERLVEISTADAAAHMWLGAVASEKGELSKAVRHFEQAAAAEPSSQVYQYLTELHIRRKDFASARIAVEDAARLSPEDHKVLMLAALVHMDSFDFRRAVRFLDDVLRIKPDFDDALFYRAVAYDNLKKNDSMRRDLERLITINPKHHQAKNYLSYSLAARGLELDYALRLVEEALIAAPTAPAYIDTLGWIYFKKGRYEDAERELDRAVELQRDWEIFRHVAEAKEKLGKEREAISAYCSALYYGAKTRDAREIEKRLSTLSKKHDPEVIFHNFIKAIISEKSAAAKIDAGFVAKTPQGAFRGTASFRAPNVFTLEIGEGLFKTFVRLEHTLEFFGAAPAMLPEAEAKDIMSVLRSIFSGVFYETMRNAAARPKGRDRMEINTADANITVSRFTGDILRIDAGRWVWKFADYIAAGRRRIPRKIEFFDGRMKIFEAKIMSLEILPVESDE